ncbi:MAG: glycosyltransferase [Candidatus Nomurabacteria bacterium]|nr:glycosyltransferase [Candidatus Nomurabacteria bacterium]
MKISIIIPCLNEEKFLPFLIEDLRNQTVKPFEILVIDAGSTDATLSKVTTDELVKVLNVAPNIGAQRTYGGDLAQGEYLFFLDADVRLAPDFLERSLKEIQNRKLNIAGFQYVPYAIANNGATKESSLLISMCYKFFDILFFLFQTLSPSGAGSGIFVTKSIFNLTGGFRNNLKFDDIEFIRRSAKIGKFGQVRVPLKVSDRRFVRYGVLKIFVSYLVLSIFFLFGLFKASEIIEYKFSDYSKK